MGTVPHFTAELEIVPDGTRLRYLAHPYVLLIRRPLMSIIAPPWGKRDLTRYFRKFEARPAEQRELDPRPDRTSAGSSVTS